MGLTLDVRGLGFGVGLVREVVGLEGVGEYRLVGRVAGPERGGCLLVRGWVGGLGRKENFGYGESGNGFFDCRKPPFYGYEFFFGSE